MARRYTDEKIDESVRHVREDGFCLLRAHFYPELIETWRLAFKPLLAARIEAGSASARGAHRYYVSLPFTEPFNDPAVYEDPDLLAIVEALAGEEIVMPELATDTPLKGSEYQPVHRDAPLRSGHLPDLDAARPYQFAINFPLASVTSSNGPLEIARGTHLLTDEDAKRASADIAPSLERVLMEPGDVMVRDVRGLHRGTPNLTDEPRTVVVVGYNIARHPRPQLRVYIPKDESARLSERGRRLLRMNPVVESLDAAPAEENYSNLYFLK